MFTACGFELVGEKHSNENLERINHRICIVLQRRRN